MTIDGDQLINTKAPAPRQMEMALASWQSWDYYHNVPYPTHAFGPQQWARDKGPFPTALPYTEILINEGAEFVFRNGSPHFSVPGYPEADQFVQKIVSSNKLDELWIPLGIDAGNQGALACKWNIDLDDSRRPVQISFLDIPQECRVWVHPHDRNRILMLRIQYPYRDPNTGDWYLYREEWTENSQVTYEPVVAGKSSILSPMLLKGYSSNFGDEMAWNIVDQQVNPFGMPPVTIIRNKAVKGNPLGEGDCWRLFRLMDRIALSMHGEDKSSQIHAEPIPVATNATIDNEGPLQPGEPMSIQSSVDGVMADMKLLEPHGRARQFTHMTMDRWEDLLYKSAGLSRVNTENITNKGNMTALAFAMTYARTISTSDRKRGLWGDNGMCVAFQNILLCLQRVGGVKAVSNLPLERTDGDEVIVNVKWPPYFEQTDEDKSKLTERTISQMNSMLIPHEDAIERVGRAEGVVPTEIDRIKKTIAKSKRAVQRTQSVAPAPPGSTLSELANIRDTAGVNNMTA